MKKMLLRLCSLILVIAMAANSLPVSAFATEEQTSKTEPATTTSTTTEQSSEESKEDATDAKIVGELVSNRDEFSKEYLLDNGNSLAVVYDSAVHYKKDGQWEEIDNTLKSKEDGTITNTAGIWDISFPQQMSGDNRISITKDGYTFSFGMAGELHRQSNLEFMYADLSDENTKTNTSTTEETASLENEPTEVAQEETTSTETDPTEVTQEETTASETEPTEATSSGTEVTTPDTSGSEPTEPAPTENTTKLVSPVKTASVTINGTAKIFDLNTAKTSRGQIRAISHTEALKAAPYKETVLTKPVSQLRYGDVYANTDIQYDIKGNQLKESIILESYSSTLRGYQFSLNTGDLVPVLAEDGHIDLYDAKQENVVLSMPAPFLLDSNDVYNYDVSVQLAGKNGSYTLTYLLPQNWLADSERAWPVVLDPVIVPDMDINNIRDRTYMSRDTSAQDWGKGQIGWAEGKGICRFLLKYDDLPSISSADVIVHAMVQLRKSSNSSTSMPVEVHKVKVEWDSSTVKWSNRPSFNSNVEDYVLFDGSSGWAKWDVTDIVREWYDTDKNTGMIFKAPDSVEDAQETLYKQVYSSDYSTSYSPQLYIVFRNSSGLEGYWDYTTTSAGRAGTGYVNNYTGNLIWIHDDIGFGGNRMPVSIQHVYNSNDRGVKTFGLGYGWRTNYNQRVYEWSKNSAYYVWEDEDSTKHYFLYESSGKYKDEDGLELTLTTTGSGTTTYCIKDKYGNKRYFDAKGRLSKLQNNQKEKSYITITYTASDSYRIKNITDGIGRVYKFTYTDDLLSKITCYPKDSSTAISSVNFEYSSYSNLLRIIHADNDPVSFGYDNHLMWSATDVDGYKVRFAYTSMKTGKPNRINKISEHDGDVLGGELNIEYAHNQTTLTDHNGNVQIMQFNNMGNTISVQDGEGHAQYSKFAKNDAEDSGKGNQLKASSKMQNTVSNLLSNTSFELENGSLWTAASGTVDTHASGYLGSKSMAVTGGVATSGAFTVEAGESCTLSAYTKATATGATLELHDGSTILATQAIPIGEWERVEVNYTNTTDTAQTITGAVRCGSGQTVYVDCVQAEKMPTASRYNILENGDFRVGGSPPSGWTGSGGSITTVSEGAAPQLDNNVIKITGSPTSKKQLTQTVNISGVEGDTYVLAGWAKANSVALDAYDSRDREFGLLLIFNYTDGTTKTVTARFNPDTNITENWQYSATAAVAKKAYSSITIRIAYNYNANKAYFDGIQLYKEEFSTSYTYDEDGNIVSVTDLQKQKTTYEYTNNDLTKQVLPNNATLTYTYDDYHNVKTAKTSEDGSNITYNFEYDKYGNNTKVSIVSGDVTLSATATYSDDGNRLVTTTDALGKVTTYNYDVNTNVLKSVMYPGDTDTTKTNYTYDNLYRMASAAVTTDKGQNLSAAYTYTEDLLTSIQTPTTTYNFTYGDFALRSSVKVGSRVLANYTYTPRDNYLSALDYGNGHKVEYTYDSQGRVTQQNYAGANGENQGSVVYRYDNDGALATVTDSATSRTTTYYYDFIDRMMKYTEVGDGYSHTVGYEYDTINNLTKLAEVINGIKHVTGYTYDKDNRVTSIASGLDTTGADGKPAIGNPVIKDYTYDGYGRIEKQETSKYAGTYVAPTPATEGTETQSETAADPNKTVIKADTFEFTVPIIPNDTTPRTSSQVSKHAIDTAGYDKEFTYTYDDNGNILTISNGENTITYAYDSANQLIREDNPAGGFVHEWAYDNAGNIDNRTEYRYTEGVLATSGTTISYAYEENGWGDLLIGYDGKTITYDNIGNPLEIRDSAGNISTEFTWQRGRQLATLTQGGKTWTFTYNADGLRTKRTDGTNTYEYVYDGDKLSQMTVGGDTLNFFYDASGVPMAVQYNGTTYYYVTNIQGDVIAILSADGTTVAEYIYDAWGNPITPADAGSVSENVHPLSILNPLRYRGYTFDLEYDLYYLQSRYYNANTCRFLNADEQMDTADALGFNLFAYCGNNPTIFADFSGYGKIYVIYYDRPGSDFYKQAKNSPYYNSKSKNVYMIGVTTREEFIDAWNSMTGTIDYVYLYLHGGEGKLYFSDGTLNFSGKQSFKNLKTKKVKKGVYLFSCKGGSGKEGNNVAWMLAKKTRSKVYACTGSVSFSKVGGKYIARKALDFGICKTFYYQKRFIYWGATVAKSKSGTRW